jgi:DNA-binding GntR family transcriptional regulator
MPKGTTTSRLSERLREVIEERIATGAYQPGAQLDETELATEFEVSRTPIREALMQLAFAGLIIMRPRRNAVVAEISPHRLCEMFEVMAELEAMCGRLAARRMTDHDHQALLDAHQACKEAAENNDPNTYYQMNEQFHLALYMASHNSFLIDECKNLKRQLSAYRRLQLRVRDRMDTSYKEHSEIYMAITIGDGESAEKLLRNHVIVQGERFADLIANLKPI